MDETCRATSLADIQRLQFRDRARAEAELLAFLRSDIPTLQKVVINTKAESLNSINGFLFIDEGEYFFKTHTEDDEVLETSGHKRELYNAGMLAQAGYPVVAPKLVRTVPGKQIAIYEKVTFETLFDLAKKEEDRLLWGQPMSESGNRLVVAQNNLDKRIFEIYCKTLEPAPRATADAPIHQLFDGRLQPGRRVDQFYAGALVRLPHGAVTFEDLAPKKWRINGVSYRRSLQELVLDARHLLEPSRPTATVCGHGDAHNGNVWVDRQTGELAYFDPAFAGFHDPLLDIVKPIFHNVFARWMYFSEEVHREFHIDYRLAGDVIEVTHSYAPSALRKAFFASKVEHVVAPILTRLAEADALPEMWRETLGAALFCCPFLTVNLAAPHDAGGKIEARYSPEIRLLGLAMAVEVGSAPSDMQTSEIREYMGRLLNR